ncbi:major facilitator superfamily domain-containing protein [Microdochium trichocladiopsis]|uniref:Major facilitator superfamily domain-containing protein n=1 Tax=Microdochium trichocladiopsis TaxID=1682393 RepID=A0A9P8YCQ8_9PEZI|nr:major facilitator superfamily domain-containing protein [Microdochium trichocladiopsis]KAH7037040.1 major facilitator superfamily domain-containing protein [Microdochium trichocladiopsis]
MDVAESNLEAGKTAASSGDTNNDENAASDPFLVDWDGPDDPQNPFNWPTWVKATNCGLVSALTFVTPLASSIFAPGVPSLMRDFHSSDVLIAAFVVSVYVLGFALGPLLWAPLSELYGRVYIYHLCNIMFAGFIVGCALAPTLGALVVFRFFAGAVGACCLTNGGGSIADQISQEKRAVAMSAFSIGPLFGPVIGPVIGGFVQDAKGWRWVFWVLCIIHASVAVAMVVFMRESYAPVLLERKAAKLRKETGDERYKSKLDTGLSGSTLFKRNIIRPLKLLVFSPICTVFALYMAMVYGYLYLLFTSVAFVFQQSYHFSTSMVGLVYIGLGVGSLVGMAWFAADSNKAIQKAKAETGQTRVKPEVRLNLLPHGAIILPVGFFIYGWTADYLTHWIAPVIGLFIIGVGNILCFMTVSVYLVDAYERYAASALAANTVFRSIAGAVLPLCALDMYRALGLGWGNSLLAFIAIAFLPAPFLILRFGERLRMKFKVENL